MGSETRHSPEPWSVIPGHVTDGVADADGAICAEGWPGARPRDDGEANARRIVACVNALAGIPTEALEAGALARLLAATHEFLRPREDVFTDEELCAHAKRFEVEVVAALRACGRLRP